MTFAGDGGQACFELEEVEVCVAAYTIDFAKHRQPSVVECAKSDQFVKIVELLWKTRE